MSFTSLSFIFIFLPIALVGYFLCNQKSDLIGKLFLLAASMFFYARLGMKGFAVLVCTAIFVYICSTYILSKDASVPAKRVFLILSIIPVVGALLYCKYLVFFELLINRAFGTQFAYDAIVLPTGISYYTFSLIAYLVDTYRGKERDSAVDFFLFVFFFPKIMVGPIALSTYMIPQMNETLRKKVNVDRLAKGLYGFVLGLSKKALLADNLCKIVDWGYANVIGIGSPGAFLTVVAYMMQIYFDFSGYCDMASGICEMLNMDLPDNFRSPYRAVSIADFWKRWHITLTDFLRNYIYIPMGGNRKGKIRTYFNNLFVFLISGLWHGNAGHFICWGAIHGVGSIISKVISPVSKKLPTIIRRILTFSFVALAWVYFRADSMQIANAMLRELFAGGIKPISLELTVIFSPAEWEYFYDFINTSFPNALPSVTRIVTVGFVILSVFIGTVCTPVSMRVKKFKGTTAQTVITVILFVWSLLSLSEITSFIYVNF